MARRRRRKRTSLGQPAGIRRLRQYGYPKLTPQGWALTDGHGNIVARGSVIGCKKIRPGTPGAWLSSERCSYNFKFPDPSGGKWYSCRGYGEGIAASCRRMKQPPRLR